MSGLCKGVAAVVLIGMRLFKLMEFPGSLIMVTSFKFLTLNPKPQTPNPKPQTPNPYTPKPLNPFASGLQRLYTLNP